MCVCDWWFNWERLLPLNCWNTAPCLCVSLSGIRSITLDYFPGKSLSFVLRSLPVLFRKQGRVAALLLCGALPLSVPCENATRARVKALVNTFHYTFTFVWLWPITSESFNNLNIWFKFSSDSRCVHWCQDCLPLLGWLVQCRSPVIVPSSHLSPGVLSINILFGLIWCHLHCPGLCLCSLSEDSVLSLLDFINNINLRIIQINYTENILIHDNCWTKIKLF